MTIEIALTIAIVVLTFFLFIKEFWPTDVNAIIILAVLGLCSQIPGIDPLIRPEQLFSGFSSNAIIAIIALMIMAAGLQSTGAMNQVGGAIASVSKSNDRLAIALLCSAAGLASGFIQNIGAVALFIPVASRISFQSNIPLYKLLLPMGFCVILGGNLSLLGNGSLIILNDLISENSAMFPSPEANTIELFSVLPVGLSLLIGGVLFFMFLPNTFLERSDQKKVDGKPEGLSPTYGLTEAAFIVPEGFSEAGKTIREFEEHYEVHVTALRSQSRRETLAPYRSSIIELHSTLAVTGKTPAVARLLERVGTEHEQPSFHFSNLLQSQSAGLSEIVLTSRSKLVGSTLHHNFFRKTYDATPLLISRRNKLIEGHRVNETDLEAGDLLLVHSPRSSIERIRNKKEIICANTECPHSCQNQSHSWHAAVIIIASLLLTLFTSWPIGLCLWLGVLGMFLTNVISPQDGYQIVSWKTVIMLAGLIPLGIAVQNTGTAKWISDGLLLMLPSNELVIQFALACMATLMTLIMSNVGATVILVPIAISLASSTQMDPIMLVLLVGISSSNSFLIPTHQANALILSAGRYQVKEFVKTGGLVTLGYILIEIIILNMMF